MAHESERQPEMEPGEEERALAGKEGDTSEPPRSAALAGGVNLLGRTLGGRYRFDDLWGEGSFARVYKVYDLHRRAYLAAKVLRSDIAHEPAFLERFRREAVVLERLQHPHIVRYYDIEEMEGFVFILTDFIGGSTLQAVLYDRHGQPLDLVESLDYLTPLASALHFAHSENVVHRDLKPANILIDDNHQVYVTDFGIARIVTESSTLTVDTTVGTPHFMSPEQILAGEVMIATDIYALGVMLYQMYTGRLPFTGDSPQSQGTTSTVRIAYEHLHVPPTPPRELNTRLPEAVQDVILRCLSKDPGQRFASVSELYEALTAAIGTPSVSLDAGRLEAARKPAPSGAPVRTEAERVPTGVGGLSEVMPVEGVADYEYPDKPKRKPKPQVSGELRLEKGSEKEGEKGDEKRKDNQEKKDEKGEEKYYEKSDAWTTILPSDRLGQITGGAAVIWAGIVLMLQSSGLGLFGNFWPWFLGGAGALVLAEVGIRLKVPAFRARPGARLVVGVTLVLAAIGLGLGIPSLWPLIIIGVGASMLAGYLLGE